VRGAPAIAVVGILSLVAEVYDRSFTSVSEFCELVQSQLNYLVSARPTAVNMSDARSKLLQQLQRWMQEESITSDELKRRSVGFVYYAANSAILIDRIVGLVHLSICLSIFISYLLFELQDMALHYKQ